MTQLILALTALASLTVANAKAQYYNFDVTVHHDDPNETFQILPGSYCGWQYDNSDGFNFAWDLYIYNNGHITNYFAFFSADTAAYTSSSTIDDFSSYYFWMWAGPAQFMPLMNKFMHIASRNVLPLGPAWHEKPQTTQALLKDRGSALPQGFIPDEDYGVLKTVQ
jgi:hypothetical protein